MNTARNIAAAQDKYNSSATGKLGVTPFLSRIANSTPSVVTQPIRTVAAKVNTASPVQSKTVGSNAQTEQMARTIAKTNQGQKTYGVPGTK